MSFFISAAASARFSTLPFALKEVRGVEPPAVEGAGVETLEPDFPFSEFFAAFSASRFCFDAEGAIVVRAVVGVRGGKGVVYCYESTFESIMERDGLARREEAKS